jgi:hypothetical protein
MSSLRSVSAAENPALATAVDAILRTQWARYIHIGTWAIGLWVACGLAPAALWCAITMSMGYLRGVVEARIASHAATREGVDLRNLYPWIAAGVGVFWAAAPVMSWMADDHYGRMLAGLMLSAGFLMVLTQFRGAPRSALIVSAPYSLLFLGFAS